LLPWHCLDVAAVGLAFLDRDPERLQRLARTLGLPAETLRGLVAFSLAIHDIGKFARAFQGLARPEGVDLVEPERRMSYDPAFRHDALGAQLWDDYLWEALRDQWPDLDNADRRARSRARERIALWLNPFFGHHGQPVERDHPPRGLDAWFKQADRTAAEAFVRDTMALFGSRWPVHALCDRAWHVEQLTHATWELAGFACVCDWLGSDQSLFGPVAERMSLEDYWQRHAGPAAERAVTRSGLVDRPTAVSFPGFREVFTHAPTPLQQWAETVELGTGPQFFLLEDTTGSGKTEAALALAHRLLADGRARGLYFALPTMATSNAMYARFAPVHRRLFAADAAPSLVLAHGARQLNDMFMRSLMPSSFEEAAHEPDDSEGSIACNAWIGDRRKKALLADLGVGTVDQALLGVLPRKHQSMRLLGLADKLLIVDEVHAYDAYTGTLLQRLLQAHARQGGSAILLSATVPARQRQSLLGAWAHGRGAAPSSEQQDLGFPLAIHASDCGERADALPSAPRSHKDVPTEFLHEVDATVDYLVGVARNGRCACWIRNSVDDAIAGFTALRERVGEGETVELFHARFTLGDRQRIEDRVLARFGPASGPAQRQGAIVVATQVVEQSLDLDFDALVTDLAPIDRLVQRAGRLLRHRRAADGSPAAAAESDARPAEPMRILSPPWSDNPDPEWLCRLLPRTQYVYRDPANLWRTQQILRELGRIHLPDDARRLLEAVYADDAVTPEGLADASGESYADERVRAATARFNALEFDAGYTRASANGGWSSDAEVGTRLADEPTIPVVLLRSDETGRPQPWIGDSAHPWALSTMDLRQGLANELPDPPQEWHEVLEHLQAAERSLGAVRFWMPRNSPGEPQYSPTMGYVRPRTSGEQLSE
jgi:CRISPR-associated endonuclease/helicase Cas3